MDNNFIRWFDQLSINDVPLVGGKNASLGEMYSRLTPLGVKVPNGFAVTTNAYRSFLEKSNLKSQIDEILKGLDTSNLEDLQTRGAKIRGLISSAPMSEEIANGIKEAYYHLSLGAQKENVDVAVRSSATAEDLEDASFAGQQETFLNIVGDEAIIDAVRRCFASLFTDRAISYRVDKGFGDKDIALSVGVQVMVRSDKSASGVMFTLDTESGFDKVIVITGIYGLGEFIVQGKVTPDEFIVFKPTLDQGYHAIIDKKLGKKNIKLIYGEKETEETTVEEAEQNKFCLNDDEILQMARWGYQIERYFSEKHGKYQPMDIEWAKDGVTNQLYIVQARAETVQSTRDKNVVTEYKLDPAPNVAPVITGIAIGTKIASGKTKVISDPKDITQFEKGEILITEITDPDWEPIMKMASAIITDKGGRTSHAAIVSRELGIPCVVGTKEATTVIKSGIEMTVDCSSGKVGAVYKGKFSFKITEHRLDTIPQTKTHITVNIGSPDDAFKNWYLPVKGVGLGRLEFIIASHIAIHPNALLEFDSLSKKAKKASEKEVLQKIEDMTHGYESKVEYYISTLADGIAKIGAVFYPNDVIIRFSDFKSNEYRKLLGGEFFEPDEENPMIGWRGASRYHNENFKKAFGLECQAMKRVREQMGLHNVYPMIPFCRTPEEGRQVLDIMAENGLKRGENGLKVIMMCEIPSNVLEADAFLELFDGMSIGSNDLSQLTLGIDRDSSIVANIANENSPSVKSLIEMVIMKCRSKGKYIGICGQAPSDYPEFAQFLVENNIESISLNPDTVIPTTVTIAEKEKELNITP